MKKKLLITLIFTILVICIFAISVSAASLSKFAPVELTFIDDTQKTAYISYEKQWDGYLAYQRDNLFIDYKDTSLGKYSWSDVKKFDMRNTAVYLYDGKELTVSNDEAVECLIGTGCNSLAVNVTHFYMPKGAKILEYSFFSAGWKSLKYVYVTKTVENIYYDSFRGSPVEEVVFEEGSQLKTIGALNDSSGTGAFQECKKLKTISLPEGLEKIGRNTFYLSGLEGTIIVPNSVTNVYAGAFLATNIETIYFGDGPLTIGYNQISSRYIKSIYLPAQAVVTTPESTWNFTNSGVTFYVVGDNDNSQLIDQLKCSTGRSYAKIVTKAEAESGYEHNAVIEVSNDLCAVFYGGNHVESARYSYENGFTKDGSYGIECTRQGCGYCALNKLNPVFKGLGYSTDGKSYRCGFVVNHKALSFYNENSKNDIVSYGLVAMGQVSENGDKAINSDLTPISNKVVKIDYFNKTFDIFEISVKNVNTMPNAMFYATAYYIVKDENGENNVMYLNLYNKEYKEENLLKNGVSYNLLNP